MCTLVQCTVEPRNKRSQKLTPSALTTISSDQTGEGSYGVRSTRLICEGTQYTPIEHVNKEGTRHEQVAPNGASIPTVIGRWTELCFPAAAKSSEAELSELLLEADSAVRDDNDVSSAISWADGYAFPTHYAESDVKCLRAAQLDFVAMVRRRQK